MRKIVAIFLTIFLLVNLGLGQEYATVLNRLTLNESDTLVFLGDSITHQCLYTQYIEDFFYTRLPRQRIRFHNAGVSGDKAADALLRFEEDVAQFKPKFITVLLGMNDGRYIHYDQATFETYERNMTTLLDRIEKNGARAIVMTPTMFDMRAYRIGVKANTRDKGVMKRSPYYNGVLAFYGAWLREQAMVRGLGFVDMYSPLNKLTLEKRKSNPTFTLIKDAIHPGAPGQVVMAYALLDNLDVPRTVSSIHCYRDEYGQWQLDTIGGELFDAWEEGDRGGFTFLADSLPWVLPDEARPGYELMHAGTNLSQEILRINGLQSGRYNVKINGQVIGTYSDVDLAGGIELQNNSKTPQYQQALQVALLNKERNEKVVHPLRNQWSQLKGRRRRENPDNPSEEFKKWYEQFKQKVEELHQKSKEYEEKIYKINQPQPRRYELQLVN